MKRVSYADIDALIDSAARARLRMAVWEAAHCPSPSNIAAVETWRASMPEWVAEEEAVYGRAQDRRRYSNEVTEERRADVLQSPFSLAASADKPETPEAKDESGSAVRWTFWQWLCWKWFVLWNGWRNRGCLL
ncbi:MAG: hypothetical protein KGL39_41220 [Patescibacteria group bacterium]|nr:hypothetical protein [Patescibacteria group bacterium]